MEGLLKNKAFLFSVLLNFSFLVLAIASCNETRQEKAFRENDLRGKLIAEERLDKFDRERQGLEERIASLSKQLEEEKAGHELTKKALLQEQLVGKAVKEELNKVTKSQ